MWPEDDTEGTSEETQNEDTSQGEETDEGSEGASEETPESEEKPEEGEEEGQKAFAKKPANRFFDPKKVPKELKPTYDAMQKAFTTGMQKSALAVRKARAFDELVNNPQFQAWVNGTEQRPEPKNGKAKASDDEGDDEDTGNKGAPDIEGMVERAVAKAVSPLLRSEYRKNAKQEWDSLIEDYPQAENYRVEIQQYMEENPGTSYSKAFKIVAFDDAAGVGASKVVSTKKRASSAEKPSNINPGEKPPGQAKSIPEAFRMAVKQQREKKG